MPKQSFDWHARFYEACANVSDEDMQELWAKILSGEITHPGNYSLRTLECLRNLSKSEAIMFKQVCDNSYRLGNNVMLPKFGNIMENNGITYDMVLKLSDCGLIKSDPMLSLSTQVDNEVVPLVIDKNSMILVRRGKNDSNKKKTLDLPEYLFTESGRELFEAIEHKSDLHTLIRSLREEYQDYEFQLAQILSRDGDNISYSYIEVVKE